MDKERLVEIAKKYIHGSASAAETEALHKWYDDTSVSEDDELVIVTEDVKSNASVKEKILQSILDKIAEATRNR